MKPRRTPTLLPSTAPDLTALILHIRGHRVILDADLARLYGVSTKRLMEQVKRNARRFPSDFLFRLRPHEKAEVVANCDHLAALRFSAALPSAFTEHGAIMAANVLNSPRAVRMSVYVVRAFVRMREFLGGTQKLARRLAALERELKQRLNLHEAAIVDILERVTRILAPEQLPPEPRLPRREIGFHVNQTPLPRSAASPTRGKNSPVSAPPARPHAPASHAPQANARSRRPPRRQRA